MTLRQQVSHKIGGSIPPEEAITLINIYYFQ
jgi:hypothetical protein